MREILFRGKMKDAGVWVYGAYCGINCETPFSPSIKQANIIMYDEPYDGYWVEVDPETVGQYTGKTVKNGKVFDGDIGKSIDGIFLVCWDEEKAAFVMRFYDYPNETLYIEEMWDDAEIIGNIHDNQEMIGGMEDGK